MVDYKEKIKKLLALSKSPNEHEAQSALAKSATAYGGTQNFYGRGRRQRKKKGA